MIAHSCSLAWTTHRCFRSSDKEITLRPGVSKATWARRPWRMLCKLHLARPNYILKMSLTVTTGVLRKALKSCTIPVPTVRRATIRT
jgi:hypothetical protein